MDCEMLDSSNKAKQCTNEGEWSEDEEESPAGITDTMLTPADYVEDNERQYILNVAPAEDSRPVSIFRNKFSEELAYPGIFLDQIALRKCKINNAVLNAGVLKQQGALERLIHLDEGFRFLTGLRGSPPYFEKAKRDLFAMIRLGPATLFCSFASAETQWIHLLRILGKLVDNKDYCDNELENLN